MPSSPISGPRPALLALVAALAAVVSACGSSDLPSAGETRTIRDARGTQVAVPTRPKRVITLSEPTLDAALALGVHPIATTSGRGQGGVSSYLARRAHGIPILGALGQPNIERVAALRPDLILVDGTSVQDASIVDKLRRIAPTAYVSRTAEDWRSAFTATARVLDRQPAGARVLADFDARVARVRAALGANAAARVSIVRWGGIGLPSVLMKELAAGRVLADLGLRRPASQDRRGPGHSVPVSLENLRAIDGDWMFFGALGTGATGGVSETPADLTAARKALTLARDTPGFTRLDAVRADRVVAVDGSAWTSAGGPLAERVVLDDVAHALAPAR
ncbi:putative siderophore-binding lipoprotein YfiY [Baekduia alba]|uniref:iron-siderophore ABC transporter substrate-binding protein n=1 Tax=Baekduia alba TaxID=2997333 RepID=UPI0023426119|nr:iron-siderophore ABC transporter substrate-binding protein [Baekduia alba]WCB95237.1 putative siderophore-binding lipoprotein YfiY [Baekduia alba]